MALLPDISTAQGYECFLAGTYPEFLERHRLPIPHWAWINPLAHGTDQGLAELAAQPLPAPMGIQPPGSWNDAVSYLAGVVLAAVQARDRALTQLQRSTLVPLELALAHSPDSNPPTPAQLVTTVIDALYPDNAGC